MRSERSFCAVRDVIGGEQFCLRCCSLSATAGLSVSLCVCVCVCVCLKPVCTKPIETVLSSTDRGWAVVSRHIKALHPSNGGWPSAVVTLTHTHMHAIRAPQTHSYMHTPTHSTNNVKRRCKKGDRSRERRECRGQKEGNLASVR